MRLKEWFGWHFPELSKVVSDNNLYAKVVRVIGTRDGAVEENREALEEVLNSEDVASQVIEAAKTSMGQDISETDSNQLKSFCTVAARLVDYREELGTFLKERMMAVAPNLTTLIGEQVGAKLISHSGSLVNLAKYPASTIQILGAEKALFRALKTRGNTPKYGLIYNSTFIGRAGAKSKGRISRYLANKCAIASRIDQFSENPTTKFGDELKK